MSTIEVVTRVGAAEHGENLFCGHRVGETLAGNARWSDLLALAVGSRRLDERDAALLEDATACTLAADPRIWPLKVTRLVSSYGGMLAGFCAGHLLLEEAIMGPWPTGAAATFLVDLQATIGPEATDEEAVRRFVSDSLAAGRRLPGFGVPFRPVDERLTALRDCLRRRGREDGAYWSLAMRLDAAMATAKKARANHSLALAAVFLDLGFEPKQVPVLTTAMLDLCFYANAIEEAALQSECLRQLPDSRVAYVGRGPRSSPRAIAKRTLDSQAPALVDPAFR